MGNAWQPIYTAPVGNSSLFLQLNGANATIESGGDFIGSARIFDASANEYCYLIKNAPIPVGDTIRLIDQAKIVLEPGDIIEVKCETPLETIDFVSSLIEDVNDSTSPVNLGTYRNACVSEVGNNWATLYSSPVDKTSFILQINAANVSETGVQVSVRIYDASEDVYAAVLVLGQVPISDALRLIDHSKIVLEPGDRIEVMCDTPGQTVDFVGSLIEDINQL